MINDAVHGEVTFDAKDLYDFVIFRSDGTPTYNFATVGDDALMGITHVIRGDDHLCNTPRQVMVYEAMGAPVPTFAHISMILGADGKKLSKRHGATSVEEYRDAGYLSDAFVNYLALLGWSLDGETTVIPRDVLASKFSLDRISKNTHVIRGDDHLCNTPRQVMVYEAMGAPVPTFAHISMILGADGKKLSKRHGATSVEEYRDAGYLSDAFVNYLALLGWSLDGETTVIPRDVLASKFSLDRISKNPATFDPKKLDWMPGDLRPQEARLDERRVHQRDG